MTVAVDTHVHTDVRHDKHSEPLMMAKESHCGHVIMYHTDGDTTAQEETYTLPPMVCQSALQTRALLFRSGAGLHMCNQPWVQGCKTTTLCQKTATMHSRMQTPANAA